MTTNSLKTFWDQTEREALTPRLQPGMLRRKAGLFAHEIARLHEAGYSLAEIQLVLSDIGLPIGKTTVAREVARLNNEAAAKRAVQQAVPPQCPKPLARPPQQAPVVDSDRLSLGATASRPSDGTATPAFPSGAESGKPTGLAGDPRTGMQIADEFFSTYSANPLFKKGKK